MIVEIESRGGKMKMKMDVRVCDIKLMVIRVVYDSSDPGAIHRNRYANRTPAHTQLCGPIRAKGTIGSI